MKYYILLKEGRFRGYTCDKDTFELFRKQRGKTIDTYKYLIKDEEEIHPTLLKDINDSFGELVYNEGIILFPEEEEYFIEGLNQYFSDFQVSMEYLNTRLKYVKLSEDEAKTVKTAMKIMARVLRICKGEEDEDEENEDYFGVEYGVYLHMEQMLTHIVSLFE